MLIQLQSFFEIDPLSLFVGIFAAFFTVLTIFYSIGFMRRETGMLRCSVYAFLTLLATLGAVFTRHLVVLVVFWGFLAFLLYLMIGLGRKERTPATAKKTFIIVGGTDALMLLGLGLVWRLAGTFEMNEINLALDDRTAFWAYICLACAAFAKAGAMPFHSWVPDTAEDAPAPVSAFLPASLDKLLGIYLLARISLDLFQMTPLMNTLLMAVGAFTIVGAAVMMALVQHDLKRLLGYHAVSQVGYMVIGIGTGNPVGIAGGLFHMLNHAIYKSCLFFGAGAVEKETGTTDLDRLGGYARVMPLTFIGFLIAAFAISGVPPLNGFASKWMIYQGIIETGRDGGFLWVIWILAAMFGSTLTLASFMKLLHAVFLGQPSPDRKEPPAQRKENVFLWLPGMILAALCVLFGVFAYAMPLKWFIFPCLDAMPAFTGAWNAGVATVLLLLGILLGFLIALAGNITRTRKTDIFVGGETASDHPDMRLSGTGFYNTIRNLPCLKPVYHAAEKRQFDPYEAGTKATFGIHKVLRYIHNGKLPSYLAWCLLGMGILLLYLFIRLLP